MIALPLLQKALILLCFASTETTGFAASGKGFGKGAGDSSYVSFDRFRASCPADAASIQRYGPSLIGEDGSNGDDEVWVAVYRSRNNMPSVFARDDFLSAMEISTNSHRGSNDPDELVTLATPGSSSDSSSARPVAVARLALSPTSPDNACVIDSMQCTLKKEDTDPECDGGSEHAEALGVCIDELVLAYLRRWYGNNADGAGGVRRCFDGGIRFRGTLVSGILLEERGFRPAEELSSDMHSHESDIDGAFEKYAERSAIQAVAKNPGARDRALRIVSELAKIDREEDKMRQRSKLDKKDEDEEDPADEFDPWASVKKFI